VGGAREDFVGSEHSNLDTRGVCHIGTERVVVNDRKGKECDGSYEGRGILIGANETEGTPP